MSTSHPERLSREHRLRRAVDFDAVKRRGTAHRGRHCVLVALRVPGEPTRLGVVASRRAVGDAVRRNRARRRLREIVRRRWPTLPHEGWSLMLVAYGSAVNASHEGLVEDVMRLLMQAGVALP
jgi:ribonuclease P protein component